jgi:ABC-type nitrate/sulfonate/bicarbonate transport system permease component
MVAIFPHSQIGAELGSILLIFTGQVWNIAFSFYSSLKTQPRELKEAATIYRFSSWQRFVELDLPFSTIGLVWNSMMSVAGGWFFLMACEMFVLGPRDFRLPGLGSFLQTAASHGDTRALLWGLAAMIGVIVLLDQLVWRPIIVWADKFKFEQVESTGQSQATLLSLLGRAAFVIRLYRLLLRPLINWMTLSFAVGARRAAATFYAPKQRQPRKFLGYFIGALALAGLAVALYHLVRELVELPRDDYFDLLRSAALTFLRVNAALLLGALWTVPVGVYIGSHAKFARIAQPLAQMAASIPATALFPVILLHPAARRPGNRRHAAHVAGHPVVHSVQRNCRRHGAPDRLEGSRTHFSLHFLGSLALPDSSGNFSLPGDRDGDGFRRSVERQHRGGIFPLSGTHRLDRRPGQHHRQRQRFRPLRPLAGLHSSHGRRRSIDQSPGLAAYVSPGRHPLQTRSLSEGRFPLCCPADLGVFCVGL